MADGPHQGGNFASGTHSGRPYSGLPLYVWYFGALIFVFLYCALVLGHAFIHADHMMKTQASAPAQTAVGNEPAGPAQVARPSGTPSPNQAPPAQQPPAAPGSEPSNALPHQP